MLSSEKACIKSSARASGWSLLKSNPFSEWGKKTGLSPKSLRRWRPKSTSCLTKFSPIMPLDKLTIPIVETISHPPRNRLILFENLFKPRQLCLAVYMLLTSSVLSTTSKQCFEQPAASFLVCSLIFIEYEPILSQKIRESYVGCQKNTFKSRK